MGKKIARFVALILVCFHISSAMAGGESFRQKTKKTVFLTGAAGFIGSNFLEYMFDKYPNYQFVVLDALTYAGSLENIPARIKESDRFTFIHGSVTDAPLVDQIMESSHLVVHFAAESHVTRSIADDSVFLNTDIGGTHVLLKALVKHAKTVERFIYISTSEVYGTAAYKPMDEAHPLNPKSPYAAAKAGADRLVYAYWCTYDIPAVIVRPFNNYGPRQHLEKMIPRFISTAMEGLPLTIHGNGSQQRDWVYTYDTATALDKILHITPFSTVKNQEINIGSGVAISVLDIAKMVLEVFGLPENHLKFIGDRPGQVDCHIASAAKAHALLGWSPSLDIRSGIRKTIEWYVKNPSVWQRTRENCLIKITTKTGEVELQ